MSGDGGQRAEPEELLWLCEELWRVGGVQFGDFSLGRTVRNSPVYLNPKLLISQPNMLARVASLIAGELQMAMVRRKQRVTKFDVIAGVPIGGLHVATALSLEMRIPLLYARPEPHPDEHERPHIEGIYRPGQTALIVDDLAAGGGSLVETAEQLRRAGLFVADAVVLVDREQGAHRRLAEMAINLHPIITLDVLLTALREAGHISTGDFQQSLRYLDREGESRSEFD
jgi:orotate phosphoribosyltransferase/uridine monophosphate synthetase